jgi:hypothetical protein
MGTIGRNCVVPTRTGRQRNSRSRASGGHSREVQNGKQAVSKDLEAACFFVGSA